MKKNYLLMTFICLWVSLFTKASAFPFENEKTMKAEETEEVKTAYGFLISDRKNPIGLYSFPVNDATKLTLIKETPKVSAGAWAKDAYYGSTYGNEDNVLYWCKFNLETGDMTVLAPIEGNMYSDMSYDYSTGKMYAISHPTKTTTELVIVNLADGTREKVMDTDLVLMTLACSHDGGIYSLDLSGKLYQIDRKNNYKITVLADLDFELSYIQCMEFDHESGLIYWLAKNSYNAAMYKIDLENMTKTRLSGMGSSGEISGVYIPFKLAEPNAPDVVKEFSIEPVYGGNKIKVNWTFPTTTVEGKPLTSMESVAIECDGNILKNYVNSTDFEFIAGGKKTVEIEAPAGKHTFKIYVSNEGGAGVATSTKAFVGMDVPAVPENLKVMVEGSKATLTWDEVSIGLEGGNIDKSTLTYTVIRNPGNVEIVKDSKELTVVDEISAMNVYSYEVTAYTLQGKGGSSTSDWVVIGNACALPFTYNFKDINQLKLWTIIDNNNDNSTWSITTLDSQPTAMYRYSSDNMGDDWLITPPLNLEGNQAYKVKFSCGAQNSSYPERIKVTLGRDKTVEAQNITLGTYELNEYGLNPKVVYLPKNIEGGNWYIGFQACSDKDMSKLYLSDIEILGNLSAEINGVVSSAGTPLSGAFVTLSNSEKTYTTDSEGKFMIREIEAGSYTLTVSLFGYDIYSQELAFEDSEKKELTVELSPIPQASVSGYVKTEKGESLPNASVYLYGYNHYVAQTDKDGKFLLEKAYCKGDYTLSAYAMNYEGVSCNIPAFTTNVTTENLTLREKLLAPSNIAAKPSADNVVLSWDRPDEKLVQFRYDDGKDPLHVLSMMIDATSNAVSGSIYDTPAVFTGMSWQVANNNDPKTTVDIVIFDLDNEGKPTKNILYMQKNVPSQDSQWSSCQFPYPIVAPHGALIALMGDAFLCMDFGGESTEWPFMPGKSCYSFDYTENELNYIEAKNIKRNFLIRAEGMMMGAPRKNEVAKVAMPMPQPQYMVWRAPENEATDVNKWTLLTAEPIATTTYTDATWKNLAKGMYKYIVKAVYSNNEFSYPAYSAMQPRLMTGDITITITTNTGENTLGTLLTLVNKDNIHNYTVTANEQGKALVSDAWEGQYSLMINKEGYQAITDELTLTGGGNITKEYKLSEITQEVTNLKIKQNGTPGSRTLHWNTPDYLEDDFEGHEDFTVNSPGTLGWSYIDGDGAETIASSNFEFPHRYEPMAFIVFNPSATTPDMLKYMKAHSGNKLLCCFANLNKRNDDYVITPKLSMDEDFVIRFWAISYDSRILEQFRVGYSITGKEKEDFIWVNEVQNVPAQWTEYIVNIPKEAKYVTINCNSDGCRALLLDDIYIGTLQNDPTKKTMQVAGQPQSYEVYLDGAKLETTQETSYTLTNLTKGNHVAGVKAVFASGTTSMSTIEFNVEEDVVGIEKATNENTISLYPLPTKDILHIDGMYQEVQLINTTGQVILQSEYTSTIQMSQYPAGIYHLIIKKKDGTTSVHKVMLVKD